MEPNVKLFKPHTVLRIMYIMLNRKVATLRANSMLSLLTSLMKMKGYTKRLGRLEGYV